jgi:type IV secretion system protein VirB9
MRSSSSTFAAACLFGAAWCQSTIAQETADPRLREVWYDPRAVVSIFVKRGVVTDIVLDPGEAITDVASGLGADCSKPEASWCVAAQPGGRHIFVKPKSTANAPNNIAVVTDKRTHSFHFVVLADRDARAPVYRLLVRAAPARPPVSTISPAALAVSAALTLPEVSAPTAAELIAERLTVAPVPANWNYSIAEGKGADDIVPTLVFDDGRFMYLRFPANREVPAVFHVLPDGAETVVNARMEGDLLVVDRVSRRLMLRAGSAVVGVWNEAFDLDGAPPVGGTTVPGVDRALKGAADSRSTKPSQNGARP